MKAHYAAQHRTIPREDDRYKAMLQEVAVSDEEKTNLKEILHVASFPTSKTFAGAAAAPSAAPAAAPTASTVAPFSGKNITAKGADNLGFA